MQVAGCQHVALPLFGDSHLFAAIAASRSSTRRANLRLKELPLFNYLVYCIYSGSYIAKQDYVCNNNVRHSPHHVEIVQFNLCFDELKLSLFPLLQL